MTATAVPFYVLKKTKRRRLHQLCRHRLLRCTLTKRKKEGNGSKLVAVTFCYAKKKKKKKRRRQRRFLLFLATTKQRKENDDNNPSLSLLCYNKKKEAKRGLTLKLKSGSCVGDSLRSCYCFGFGDGDFLRSRSKRHSDDGDQR